jgi:hypothetical protein
MSKAAEHLIQWEPISGLPRILDPASIVNHHGKGAGLSFTLAEPTAGGRSFSVVFSRVFAFRLANESYRLKMLESIQNELPWPTYKVENSEWTEWFHDQTFGIYRDWPIKHFLFIGEEVVDVLSTEMPKFVEDAD